MALKRLEPEKVAVKVRLVACDGDQIVKLDVTREQLEVLTKLKELTDKEHEYMSCYPGVELEVLD